MALDGVFIKNLVAELNEANGAHIDKIHQPSADELVLILRKPAFNKRLLISTRQGQQRLHFSATKHDNPDKPPMFCMLLRKYVGSGRILSVVQPDFERLVEINFSALNEMGDIITPRLIIELISSSPNVILVGENGKIIDALKRSSFEAGGRLIQPGATYCYPDRQNKLPPTIDNLYAILSGDTSERGLLSAVAGFSPLICREISGGYASLEGVISAAEKGHPYMLKNAQGEPMDFSYIPIRQYGYPVEEFPSFSELLDAFYSEKATLQHLRQRSADIEKLLSTVSSRISRRMNLRRLDLEKCKDREKLRISGELIKANLHQIEAGATRVRVQNFYDENLADIEISLDPALSPQANAAKYFKDYKKAHTAEQTLASLIENDEKELAYLETVSFNLSCAEAVSDIAEIREELAAAGYIRAQREAKAKKPAPKFAEFTSPSGYRVLVGKNNLQNDLLTTKIAEKNDMWFHTKNIAGSHVIVACGSAELTREDILFAATLAAKNSKAGASSQVPVDYTRIKNVKKPAGAKAGMVIYLTNSTVYVTPSEVNND